MVLASFNKSNNKDFFWENINWASLGLELHIYYILGWKYLQPQHGFLKREITLYICHAPFLGSKQNTYILFAKLLKLFTCTFKSIYICHAPFFGKQKKQTKTFLEGTCFAEVGLPNASCLQGTPKYKICFGDMCLVKNPFFVLMSI